MTATLDAAERPVVWAGVGVLRRGLGERVTALAERVGAPVVESVMGKGAVAERHPLSLGVYSGATSDERVSGVVEGADAVLALGLVENDINLGAFTVDIPAERRISVNERGVAVGHRTYGPLAFEAVADALFSAPLRERAAPEALPHAWDALHCEDGRVTCDSLAGTLNDFLVPDDILVSDVGVAAHLTMDVRLAAAGQLHIARYYVGMGFAVPAATGAVLARGQGRAIVLVGDGSFQMTGFDLSTAVRYGAKPIVLVLDNHGYGAERSIVDGPFNDVARWDYAAVGAVVGAEGANVSTLAELTEALGAARRDADRAWIIGVDLDAHDFPRALRRLGEGLERLMHRG
ncbi:MAG: thiamine pyrophosphate-dependent enzyme [Miltoncostaeaceae bacterium]